MFRLIALMPLARVHALGTLVGRVARCVPGRPQRTADTNIGLCFPAWDTRDRDALAAKTLIESAKAMVELAPLWCWSGERILGRVVEVSGEQYLSEPMQQGRAVLLATAHLGAWELIGLYCGSRYPMTSMYRPPRQQGFEAWMCQARERTGAALVRADQSGVRAVIKALKAGELACILPDQEPKAGEGVFAPFFGVPALTMSLFPRLAAKSGAAVVFAWVERLPQGRGYHIRFQPVGEGIHDTDVVTSATAMNAAIEAAVSECPAQYQWTYKRFRALPEGGVRIYR
ncbi:MAG TPA: hypothetical protein EYN01_00060 [Chromatiales bacterium]|nr:hypothetical protein [Chromatiales bacterium]